MLKKLFALYFVYLASQGYSQTLDVFVTKEVVRDPWGTIKILQHQKPQTRYAIAQNYYVLGKCYAFLNYEDAALNNFLKAKKEFEQIGAMALASDISFDAHVVISSQENYDRYHGRFLKEFYLYAAKTLSPRRMALCYNEFGKDAYDLFNTETRENPKVLDSAFSIYTRALKLARTANDTTLLTKIYLNIATLKNTAKQHSEARIYADSARFYALKIKNVYEEAMDVYTYGLSYFMERDYEKALPYFIKAGELKMPYYREKLQRKIYKKLVESYDMLKDDDNRHKYQSLFENLDKRIQAREQNISFYTIDVRYNLEGKNRKISTLEKAVTTFEHNKIIYSILLFLVFLLALYSYVRWKKVDRRRKNLEREKNDIEIERTQAVEQLEKVRQLVIKNKIVLKNKSTVSLDNLMYIQVEDHYLHLVLNEGKKEFLRGKLAEILDQLPPNFRKCHRSYIVNTNYIKSLNSRGIVLANKEVIPVSRDFKL